VEQFDYLKFDPVSDNDVRQLRYMYEGVGRAIRQLPPSRELDSAIEALDVSYMWAAKCIHNDRAMNKAPCEEGPGGQ
jgi:hypothetical protein